MWVQERERERERESVYTYTHVCSLDASYTHTRNVHS